MNGTIAKIRKELLQAFDGLLYVFSTREDMLYYKPASNGWSIHQVLEHVMLANYFLLRIVQKQTRKALQQSCNIQANSNDQYIIDVARLQRMELTGSYVWVPKSYTEPDGNIPLLQLKMTLHDQLNECLKIVQNKKAMEGITRTYEAGKIDALHYLYFLVQHIQRHLDQVQRLEQEFNQLQKETAYTNADRLTRSICLN